MAVEFAGGRPVLPSATNLTKWMRLIDPDDPTVVAEIGLVDTGLLTPDGFKKYALLTASMPPSSAAKIVPYEGAAACPTAGTAVCLGHRAITGVATGLGGSFDILGNWEDFVAPGDTITVADSTGNDGTWTVLTVTYAAGTTTIAVIATEDITDATVDGVIVFDELLISLLFVQALTANTGYVVVGSISIAIGVGMQLWADAIQFIEGPPGKCIDLNDIYLDVAVNAEGITWQVWR